MEGAISGGKQKMNKITLRETIISDSSIVFIYDISGEWSKFFSKTRAFHVKYSADIHDTPKSIANIIFAADVLPLSWVFDAEVNVDCLDKDFTESLNAIKKNYAKMYSGTELHFNGKLNVKKLESNHYKTIQKAASFFSGGVDATSTVATHYKEKPLLINIQGSDINLSFKKTIEDVQSDIEKSAKALNLPIIFVRSEFRKIMDYRQLKKYFKPKIHDDYWHALQYSLGITGHSAPILYRNKIEKIYIASSHTAEDRVPAASDPDIDNNIRFGSSMVSHDGFEMNRTSKCKNIASFIKQEKISLKLRVCLEDDLPNNCENCEKCFRTIMNFASEGIDPSLVGFSNDEKIFKKIRKNIEKNIIFKQSCAGLWKDIQNKVAINNIDNNDVDWIKHTNFDTINDKHKIRRKLNKIYHAIERRLRKLKKICLER